MCVYIYINNFAAFSFNNSLCLVVHKYDLMQTTSCKIQFLHLLLTTVISRTGSRFFAHVYVLFCTRAWDISPQPDHILFAAECNLYITVLKAWKCGARISVHYLCFKSDFTHITLITTNCSKKHWCSCVAVTGSRRPWRAVMWADSRERQGQSGAPLCSLYINAFIWI